MTTCWKCGRETPNQNCECDGCEAGDPEARIAEALAEMDRQGIRFYNIDWAKVQTPQDHVIVLRALIHEHISIPSNHPDFERLKPYFKTGK